MSDHFVCATCGQSHDGLPTDLGFKLPDDVWAIPAPRREEVARFTDDLCQYGDRYFIRGLLLVPLPDMGSDFGWGVWAEVDVAVASIRANARSIRRRASRARWSAMYYE